MEKKKRGRPTIQIDEDQFSKLCYLQCTLTEIASFFNCSPDKIQNWCRSHFGMTFTQIYDVKSAGGKTSLRRAQFRLAETNASMAIFLGKQYLGQRDYIENTINNNGIIDDLIGALNNAKKNR